MARGPPSPHFTLTTARRDWDLCDTVEVEVTATATTGDIRWVVLAVNSTEVQQLADAFTFEAFEDPVPAGDCTLETHNVAVYATAEEAEDAIDDASLGAFLR